MKFIVNKAILQTQNLIDNLSKKKFKKTPLIKTKIIGNKNVSGRNNTGKITIYHKGGGHKKKYRKIEFLRTKDSTGVITSIEYDPYRTALIASVYDVLNSEYFYIIAPKNLTIGNIVSSGMNADTKVGHCLPMMNIPIGTLVHNISLTAKKKAQLVRSAGTHAQIIKITSKHCKVILSSGKHKFISSKCHATIGTVSTKRTLSKLKKKAGRNRWLNIRPTVRGVAMNPVDHPHGGGEGKASGGKYLKTPWGKP